MHIYSIANGPRVPYLAPTTPAGSLEPKWMHIRVLIDGDGTAGPIVFAPPSDESNPEVGIGRWCMTLSAAYTSGLLTCPTFDTTAREFETAVTIADTAGPFFERVPDKERTDPHACYICFRLYLKLHGRQARVPVCAIATENARSRSNPARALGEISYRVTSTFTMANATDPVLLFVFAGNVSGSRLPLASELFTTKQCELDAVCTSARCRVGIEPADSGLGSQPGGGGGSGSTSAVVSNVKTIYIVLGVAFILLALIVAAWAGWHVLKARAVSGPSKINLKPTVNSASPDSLPAMNAPTNPSGVSNPSMNAVDAIKSVHWVSYGMIGIQIAAGFMLLFILKEIRELIDNLNKLVPTLDKIVDESRPIVPKVERAMDALVPLIPKVDAIVQDIRPIIPQVRQIVSDASYNFGVVTEVVDKVDTTLTAVDAVQDMFEAFE